MMRTRNIKTVPAQELQRVGVTSFEHNQYVFMIRDLASLSHTPQYATSQSVFRINKDFIDGKGVVKMKIIDSNHIQMDGKIITASYQG